MNFLDIFFIAVALAMDAFAVAVAAGFHMKRLSFRPLFRLSWHFGLFQALMPVIGWVSGMAVAAYIAAYDHWAAFGLLLWVGGGMIRESFDTDSETQKTDPTKGMRMVLLSIATSIDALAVGFTLATLNVPILTPVLVIGFVALVFTLAGMILGNKVLTSGKFGKRAELAGGLVLIGIGVKILIEHHAFVH